MPSAKFQNMPSEICCAAPLLNHACLFLLKAIQDRKPTEKSSSFEETSSPQFHPTESHPKEPHDVQISRPAEDVILDPGQHPAHQPSETAEPRKHQQDDEQGEPRILVTHLELLLNAPFNVEGLGLVKGFYACAGRETLRGCSVRGWRLSASFTFNEASLTHAT